MALNGGQGLPKNPIMQVIDGDGVLNPNVGKELEQWGFGDAGDAYYVVAILGAQSSGKSTLMNLLFGTDFSVMMARTGRRQTTLGVWLGLSTPASTGMEESKDPVVVLDVEGTDSRERGEDHGQFERKTSLLSLALAEILIINMWTTDVGRHDGANYGLLKVVFELNLQLFQAPGRSKSMLLFVFRDHSQLEEDTPLEYLINVIREDMDRIWSGISKPDNFASSHVGDFFDFQFVSLPPKPHAPDRFATQVLELKRRFLDPNHKNRLLSTNYKKDIPADGFAKYVEDIWETIRQNKDLNIPSQKEMLSMFRCDQLATASYDSFNAEIDTLKPALERKQAIPDFGFKISLSVRAAFELYDQPAKRYVASVANTKRSELGEKMLTSALKLYKTQVNIISSDIVRTMNDGIAVEVTSLKPAASDFNRIVTTIRDRALTDLEDKLKTCIVAEFEGLTGWTAEPEISTTRKTVIDRIRSIREAQFQAVHRQASVAFERTMSQWLKAFLENGGSTVSSTTAPAPHVGSTQNKTLTASGSGTWSVKTTTGLADTWSQIQSKYLEMTRKMSDDLIEQFNLLGMEGEFTMTDLGTVAIMKKVMVDLANSVGWMMDKRFGYLFKFDKDRLPRRWKPSDDIKGEFRKACTAAERLLDQVSVLRLEESERGYSWLDQVDGSLQPKTDEEAVPEQISIIGLTDIGRHLETFRDKARGEYLQASVAQESAVKGSYTVIVAVVIFLLFGWDETIFILTNPLALALVCVLLVAAFLIHQLNLYPVIMPLINTVTNVALAAVNGGATQAPAQPDPFNSSPPIPRQNTRSTADLAKDIIRDPAVQHKVESVNNSIGRHS